MQLFATARTAIERWWTMRELRSIENDDSGDHYWEFRNLINEAMDVFERDQRVRATQLWTQALTKFPDLAMKSKQALDLLLCLQLYDEAEALLTKCQARFPRHAHCMEGLALVAYKRGNRQDAVDRCILLRRKYPGNLKGYWIAAAALSELDRSEDAEAMLIEGLRLMPDDVALRIHYGHLATRRRDWTEALKRWTDVYETFGHLAGVVGSANALKELGRHDEAEQLLSGAMYKAGNDVTVWLEFVSIAEHKRDWEEAALRWTKIRDRFPLVTHGYIRGIRPLLELGQHLQAENVLLEGIDRMPAEAALLIEHAWFAHRRSDWTEAANRWAIVRERFPKRREGHERGADALAALGQTEEAARLRAG
jgi:tetratricopeptide (TPR) repeat protein